MEEKEYLSIINSYITIYDEKGNIPIIQQDIKMCEDIDLTIIFSDKTDKVLIGTYGCSSKCTEDKKREYFMITSKEKIFTTNKPAENFIFKYGKIVDEMINYEELQSEIDFLLSIADEFLKKPYTKEENKYRLRIQLNPNDGNCTAYVPFKITDTKSSGRGIADDIANCDIYAVSLLPFEEANFYQQKIYPNRENNETEVLEFLLKNSSYKKGDWKLNEGLY